MDLKDEGKEKEKGEVDEVERNEEAGDEVEGGEDMDEAEGGEEEGKKAHKEDGAEEVVDAEEEVTEVKGSVQLWVDEQRDLTRISAATIFHPCELRAVEAASREMQCW